MTSILQKNQGMARIAMGYRYEKLDWSIIESRRDKCREIEETEPWQVCSENFLLLPQLMPSSDKTSAIYADLNKGLRLGNGIQQYIDQHGKDPHLLYPILNLRQAVTDQQFDCNNNITTDKNLKPYFMVALGTGDGATLKSLIARYQPHHLVIAVSDWQDFATSFWSIDWIELKNQQELMNGGNISIACYQSGISIIDFLQSTCLVGIDHTVLYLPPDGGCSKKAKLARNDMSQLNISNRITYLGYTIDEHNMVWNSWQSLSREPRVFNVPKEKLGGRMVVCGSGPSLDSSIEALKELSKTHIITACGSNVSTLKAHGIRVDILALLEREDLVASDMQQVVQQYGAGSTHLFMSTTCPSHLQSLFKDTMVFFRPALTPLALFSNSPSEVLILEGPDSVNTGVALAGALGMNELVLVGVDLGARSLSKVRSDLAQGTSERSFELEESANFGGKVFTTAILRDSCLMIEACLKFYSSMRVINVSDGIAIDGAEACVIDDYINQLNDDNDFTDFSSFNKWWEGSPRYTSERFNSSWSSRRPRANIALFINSFRDLLLSCDLSSPNFLKSVNELLDLSVPLALQFPRRVLRSTLFKIVISINRQKMVMSSEPDKSASFETAARQIVCNLLNDLEIELYQLCDAVENMC